MQALADAVDVYFKREAEAMTTPQGADHSELIEQVAVETGIETDVLTEAILDASVMGAN